MTDLHISKRLIFLSLEKVLKLFSVYLTSFLIAPYLGVEQFGLLNLSLSIVNIFLVVTSFGLGNIILTEYSKSEKEDNKLILNSIFVRAILSIFILFTGYFLIKFFFENDLENQVISILIFIVLAQIFFTLENFFIAANLSHRLVIAKTFGFAISLVIKILAVNYDLGILFIAYSYLIDSAIVALIYFLYFAFETKKIEKIDITYSIQIIKKSLPVFLGGVFAIAYMRIDQIMLYAFDMKTDLGLYSVSVQISELAIVFPSLIILAATNDLARKFEEESNKFKESYRKIFKTTFILVLFEIIIIIIFGESLISLIYSQEFIKAYDALIILIFNVIFIIFGIITTKILVIQGNNYFVLIRGLLGFLINFILNFILIPWYGSIGAAISSLVALVIANFISDYFNSSTKDLFYDKTKTLFLK